MAVDLLNVKGLRELDPSAPVVMVNLMRFRERSLDGDGSGWDAYLRYSALTVPMIKARGGTLLWTGDAKAVALGQQAGNRWDYLALVYYPDVAAFIDMMRQQAGGLTQMAGAPFLFAPAEGPSFFTPHGWTPAEVRTMLKAAGKLGRLPLTMRAFALLPESDAPRGNMPWSAVCLLARNN